MTKPRLSKELFQRGLTPRDFELILEQGFHTGADVRALRTLLQLDQASFASALGIPEEFLSRLEESEEAPSAKLSRRLIRAAADPATFSLME